MERTESLLPFNYAGEGLLEFRLLCRNSSRVPEKGIDGYRGICYGSITEDLQTTIHLYANGWKGYITMRFCRMSLRQKT